MLKILTIAGFALAVATGSAHAQSVLNTGWGCRNCGFTNGTSMQGINVNNLNFESKSMQRINPQGDAGGDRRLHTTGPTRVISVRLPSDIR